MFFSFCLFLGLHYCRRECGQDERAVNQEPAQEAGLIVSGLALSRGFSVMLLEVVGHCFILLFRQFSACGRGLMAENLRDLRVARALLC
jgi:hypothetical protein